MDKCKHCGNILTGRKIYCSPKCKQAAYRNNRNTPTVTKEPVTVTDVTVTPTVTSKVTPVPECGNVLVRQLTRKQLKSAIDNYPEDTWKDSPEYAELIRRLREMSIDELKAEGYWLPMWKLHGYCGKHVDKLYTEHEREDLQRAAMFGKPRVKIGKRSFKNMVGMIGKL
ncbi:MAG: hypothetical protein ACYSUX_00345 [Planctomycetota bacterium]